MWLINVENGLLEEFIGARIPPYAILSHTWEDGQEVTFQEVNDHQANKGKRGYQKIKMTCKLAAEDGLQYVWVDTCCIDKSSSAELTEAINSMYNWYKRSAQCYAYLSDLSSVPTVPLEGGSWAVEHCRWFRRGWTLQELIAPTEIKFYNQDWRLCFKRSDASDQLAQITGVESEILNHTKELSMVSVAQKMSWAASRQSTRIEDTAYCLLGIFEINMPLLYGEEERAFTRLQAEIIKSCPDPSIFAWTHLEAGRTAKLFSGVLAPSPESFSSCRKMIKLRGLFIILKGLQIKGP
ncbi:HET-domain-containing protein [Thozetella sp. PMI_491]|nr:HET-domain-containing protein [Thozetella sp. PMI_491]